jgi:hypothetical protein
MDISVSSVATQVEDRSWLSSNFGCDEPRTITLDISAFTAGTHYPNGYIPSGITLARITATGLYGPYNNALATGQEVAAGHLFSAVKVPNPAVTTIDAGGAMLEMGLIVEAKLPAGHGLDAAAKTDLAGWFKYL